MSDVVYCLILLATVIIGALLARFIPWDKSASVWRKLIIPFSGAFLLGIVVLHLLPEVFHQRGKDIAIFILAGFVIQLVLDILSQGIEHGHLHAGHGHDSPRIWSILIGLSVHSFLEGLPLAHDHSIPGHDHDHGSYLWAIVAHKLPAAFTLASLLFMSLKSKLKSWIYIIVFGLMSPLAILLAGALHITMAQHEIILALVSGSLLHVSTTIIFEVDSKGAHQLSLDRILAISLGLVIAYFIS